MNKFILDGNHDEDDFLSREDMTEVQWNILMSCHHQGQCEDDAREAAKHFEIKDYIRAVNYLIECGIERDRFGVEIDYPERVKTLEQIKDMDAVFSYYIWMISGDIQDRMYEVENE